MVWIFWNRVQSIFLHWWKVFSIESWHYLDNNLHWKPIMIYPINIYQTWYVLDWWPHHVTAYYNTKYKIFTLLILIIFNLSHFSIPPGHPHPIPIFLINLNLTMTHISQFFFFLNLSLLIIFPYSDWAISLSNLINYLHAHWLPPFNSSLHSFILPVSSF